MLERVKGCNSRKYKGGSRVIEYRGLKDVRRAVILPVLQRPCFLSVARLWCGSIPMNKHDLGLVVWLRRKRGRKRVVCLLYCAQKTCLLGGEESHGEAVSHGPVPFRVSSFHSLSFSPSLSLSPSLPPSPSLSLTHTHLKGRTAGKNYGKSSLFLTCSHLHPFPPPFPILFSPLPSSSSSSSSSKP